MTQNDWEKQLKEGLDALSDMSREEPPSLADLQMLVVQVQREQRQRTARDLALFWLCAIGVLLGCFYVFTRQPVYFLALQGVLSLGAVAGLLVWVAGRKRVTE